MSELNESLKIDLNTESNTIFLYALSDLHIGDSDCDIATIKKVVDFIKNTPNAYAICIGDILNTALKTSKSDIYSEVMSISDAQKLAVELLTPIKDKILAFIPGNHENRVWREVGIDLSLWLAEKLDVQDKYRVNGAALSVSYGKDLSGNKFNLHVFCQHGSYGGGRKLGAAMNAIEEMDGIVANADIYLRAHTHSPVQGSRKVYLFNDRGNMVEATKYYFNAPSALTYGGYGYEKGYRPQDNTPCYLAVHAISTREGSRLNKSFKVDKITL